MLGSRGVFPLILLAARAAAAREAVVFASPDAPAAGRPVRLVAVSLRPLDGTLALLAPDGARVAATDERHGGPPWWWYLDATPTADGVHRVCLESTCADVAVGARSSRPAGVWPVSHDWDAAMEALYSAWVEKLFDDPLDAEPSWPSLDAVTGDPARNFLHDHLGRDEDGPHGLRLRPDCADLPYFLRAYFAWKLGLPFGWSACSRGAGGQPPRCSGWRSNVDAVRDGGDPLARMQVFFARDLAWGVQSGAGRAPADDDHTDFYPTRLSIETLIPGTVYADPYGHTLVLARRVPQTPSSPGLLLAVDAQPDGTVARKRYWRGNFLFALDPALGSAGFKHFRPIVRDGRALRPLANREILLQPDWGDYSLDQYQSDVDGFYDRVESVLSPEPVDPAVAFRAAIDALDEQIGTRIRAVANGEAYVAAHSATVPMPEGAEIFETTGPWEDYATPARDLRLLIAIDVVRGFPAKAARRPDAPPDLGARLESMLRDEEAGRRFDYVRSDGSTWTLTLGDVLSRAEAFEVAYDPNDCVEARWGAPPGSEEIATCRRRAPAEQAARMGHYRAWFRERSRPPR
jgi:hypothetical protein